jgi:hypothetical protein
MRLSLKMAGSDMGCTVPCRLAMFEWGQRRWRCRLVSPPLRDAVVTENGRFICRMCCEGKARLLEILAWGDGDTVSRLHHSGMRLLWNTGSSDIEVIVKGPGAGWLCLDEMMRCRDKLQFCAHRPAPESHLDFMYFSCPNFFRILEIPYLAVAVLKYHIACTTTTIRHSAPSPQHGRPLTQIMTPPMRRRGQRQWQCCLGSGCIAKLHRLAQRTRQAYVLRPDCACTIRKLGDVGDAESVDASYDMPE